MNPELETLRAEMDTLRRLGGSAGERALASWVAALDAVAAHDADRWLSEPRALRRSGKTQRWLRARFRVWQDRGYAELREGKHYYHDAVVPCPQITPLAADDAREQARRDAEAA